VASLSAWLQRFFEGWVGEICRELNAQQGSELIYTVYSGGDDVFAVGTWHVLPELARRIREDFARFACRNPAVTLSAGLTLHDGKYPLLGMAEQAGEALSGDGGAKDFCRPNGREKDALNFLGLTVGWEECARVWQLRDELERLSSTAGRGLLQLLQRLCLMAGSGRNRLGQEQVGPWVWLAAYFLTRAARQHREEAEAILSFRDLMGGQDSRERLRLLLAARWAELLTRRQESK
jgi:CRISPR-associated protein Csm1